jgi:hypothetical protein
MTNSRLAALIFLAGVAHVAAAQGTQPTPPAAAPAPALKLPANAPPPPRPAPLVPASQRTPTPALSLKPAPDVGLARPSSVHPDSARAARQRAQSAAIAAAAPAARLASPPRRTPTPAATTSAKTVNTADTRPIGATMRCKDGTYLTGAPSADRCSGNGGVAVTYSPQSPALVAPRPQPQKRP